MPRTDYPVLDGNGNVIIQNPYDPALPDNTPVDEAALEEMREIKTAVEGTQAAVAADRQAAEVARDQAQTTATSLGAIASSVSRPSNAAYLDMRAGSGGGIYEAADAAGGRYLPGLGGRSVQDHFKRLTSRLSALEAAATTESVRVNAVTDLGCDPTGKAPCQSIINSAINRLTAANIGPCHIYFPRGRYLLTDRIQPKSNVSIIGEARDGVVFLPTGIRAAFDRRGNLTWLENCVFRNFSVDGIGQVLNGGSYDVQTKGAFFQGFRNCLFVDLHFKNTGATSLGIDFADASIIQRVLVENGGRLATVGQPGASGIGIGTGWLQSEPLIIADCICLENKNYGIFVERQVGAEVQYDARHNIFIGNICRGNNHAFGEAGCSGSIVVGNQFTDSLGSGVALHRGTLNNGPHPGSHTVLRNNLIARNAGGGVEFDGRATFGPWGYSSGGNQIRDNGGHGHWLRGGTGGTVQDFRFGDDEIWGNAGHAIYVESGTFENLDIMSPRCMNNAGAAIRLDAPITGGRIFGATIRDLRGVGATQTQSIIGSGALTDFDISETHGVGCSAINLTGTLIRVTYGRNPGV